jgi:transposase
MNDPTSQTSSNSALEIPFAAFISIDWGDEKHTVCLQSAGSKTVHQREILQTPEALSDWCNSLLAQFPGQKLAIIIEGNRSGLIYHLLGYSAFVIYPINPKAAAKYREAIYPNGSKTDPIDAGLLLDFLLHHRDCLRPLVPDTAETRLLGQLSEDRRRLVDTRTELLNLLTSRLKLVFPQVLALFDAIAVPMVAEFVKKWPSLEKLQQAKPDQVRRFFYAHNSRSEELIVARLAIILHAKPLTQDVAILTSATMMIQELVVLIQGLHKTIARYDERLVELTQAHSLAPIFASLPGAGKILVPRLISALGTQSERWPKAYDLLCFSGVAPVEVASGKQYSVHWRWNCPRFLRQTFVEFAYCSTNQCAWAKAYYDDQRSKGKKHHQAIRALAFKWIRIIWKCWKDKVPYDDSIYLKSLENKNAPLLVTLNKSTTPHSQPLSNKS